MKKSKNPPPEIKEEEIIHQEEQLGKFDLDMIKLQQELKVEKNKYLRLLAETENSRKRMQKEKHEMTRFAVENVVAEFLDPLDSFENALGFAGQASEETKNWAMGFQMILTQIQDILTNYNVTPFHCEGEQFDPHLHEAIELEETEEAEEGKILKEFAKGYKCGDRILRPARVKVAKRPIKMEEQQVTKEKQNEGEDKND